MPFGVKNDYIPAGTKVDQQAMRSVLQSCKALHKDVHHLEELSKHALDEFLWPNPPERSHLSEKMVRWFKF